MDKFQSLVRNMACSSARHVHHPSGRYSLALGQRASPGRDGTSSHAASPARSSAGVLNSPASQAKPPAPRLRVPDRADLRG
jgi:hypothetical protein